MSRKARDDRESAKRRKVQDSYVIDIDDDISDSDNEYLPRMDYEDDKSSIPKVPEKPAPQPSTQESFPSSSDKTKEPRVRKKPKQPSIDPFLEGISRKDKPIILALRSQIEKSNCKHHVVKALQAFRNCDARTKALEKWTIACAGLKNRKT